MYFIKLNGAVIAICKLNYVLIKVLNMKIIELNEKLWKKEWNFVCNVSHLFTNVINLALNHDSLFILFAS